MLKLNKKNKKKYHYNFKIVVLYDIKLDFMRGVLIMFTKIIGFSQHQKAISENVQIAWQELIHDLIKKETNIITLRGAGSVNGMDKQEIDILLDKEIIPRIIDLIQLGPLAIIYDGDPDDIKKPDIGYVMGRIADRFQEEIQLITAFKKKLVLSYYRRRQTR